MDDREIPPFLDSLAVESAPAAWGIFLREFSPLILQVVRLFERDPDLSSECFLFVCEHLQRDRLRRLRRFRAGGAASFPTWLRAVARNLCVDWHRHHFGRRRLPASVARMSALDAEIFRCRFERGLSSADTLSALAPRFASLTPE